MTEEKKRNGFSKLETSEVPPKPIVPIEEPIIPPEEKKPIETPEERELKSKKLMLKMGFGFAGNAMQTYTDDPDMNLNDDEMQALIEVWEPFLPDMPPWICAAIVTGTVFGKKFLIYRRKHKKKKDEKSKDESKSKPEAGKSKPEAGKVSLEGL